MKWLARQVSDLYLILFRPDKWRARPRTKDDTGSDNPMIYFR
ncbi:MAG TPA: hypothetical protein VMD91_19140 [Candidatus Sulfotelmatobacter sp.]|nr:hypothetical protein [Candidatus Sulfotelmatobacter sp.]